MGSFFSGIGGFELAAQQNGVTPVWASEIDEHCIKVTSARFPALKHYGDITKIHGSDLEQVDIVTGGSPCQDLSVAGKQEGLKGERSGLFLQMIRVIKEMIECGRGPRYIIWENVPGAFSSNNGKDFLEVLRQFAGFWQQEDSIPIPKCGYWKRKADGTDAEWVIKWPHAGEVTFTLDGVHRGSISYRVFDAQYAGVPQQRRRIFLVADLRGDNARKVLFEFQSLSGYIEQSQKERKEVAKCLTTGTGIRYDPETESLIVQTFCLQGAGKTCQRSQGNTIKENVSYTLNCMDVHGVAYAIRNTTNDKNGPNGDICLEDKSYSLTGTRGSHAVVYGFNGGVSSSVDPQVKVDMIPTLISNQVPNVSCNFIVRRLMPLECERLQGFPTILEVNMEEISKDEYIALCLASGNISVNFETGAVYRHRGPGGMKLAIPIEMHGSNVNGYLAVNIHFGKEKRQCRIHRIIWIAAHGVLPNGMVLDHINNDKMDNRLCNLQLVTPEDNSHKAWKDGLYCSGEDSPASKINNKIAQQICDDYKQGDVTMRDLADKYGISKSRIHQIIHNQGWTDLGLADTVRYRMLGNSVAVPVVSWIFKRLVEVSK